MFRDQLLSNDLSRAARSAYWGLLTADGSGSPGVAPPVAPKASSRIEPARGVEMGSEHFGQNPRNAPLIISYKHTEENKECI